MDFQQFLEILWKQEANGEFGFEGLVRKLLEKATGQRFFLSLSGRQEGRDAANEGYVGNFLAAECKRYKEDSSLGSDELLSKFLRAAKSTPTPDIWIVVTTKRLGEQHHRDLLNAGDQFGISYFPIDAEGGEESLLAALCAEAPKVVASHLKGNPPRLKDPEADEVEQYLSGLFQEASRDRLRDALLHDAIGYAHWRAAQNHWLLHRLESPSEAYAAFAQDFAVRARGRHLVSRSRARQALDNWWTAWPQKRRALVILGEEGDGKSWVVADWLADKLPQENFPPVLFVPSTRISEADPMEFTIQALRWQIGEARTGYWVRRLRRWLDRSTGTDPVFVLALDGLNERPGFEWRLLLSRLEAEPFGGRVAILNDLPDPFLGRTTE